MKFLVAAVVIAFATYAHAQTGDRCNAGIAAAQKGDLPHAALYLEGCSGDAEAVAADVQRKLRASQLSALSISSTPSGLAVETDAMPGEKLVTPATVWTKAGTYKVRLVDTTVEQTVKVDAHSRASAVLTPPKAAAPPKDGTVNFDDQPTDPPVEGPPPPVKHKSLLPCKYTGGCTAAGEPIDDPLATEREYIPPYPPHYALGVRAGVVASPTIGPSFALDARHDVGPFVLEARPLDYSRRGGVDTFGVAAGISKVVLDPDAAWLSLGLAARGELRTGDRMDLARFGGAAAGSLELALRKLPVVIGARYEQGLTDGMREHAVILELGGELRAFSGTR